MHPDDGLMPAAVRLATELAAHPPLAAQVGKAFINRDAVGGFNESVGEFTLLFATAERRAAFRAFRDGRRQEW